MAEVKKIGRRKYEALKRYDLGNMSEDDLEAFNATFKQTIGESIKQIKSYEKQHATQSKEQIEKHQEYLDKIRNKEVKKEPIILTKDLLWKRFTDAFFKTEGKYFKSNEPSIIENIKPLIYYFIGDQENFQKCANVSLVSVPDVRKGLLIIGGYGNGKTSMMKSLEQCFVVSNMAFRGYTTNKIVSMYEACQNPLDKEEFYKTMNNGVRYFDDVMTEREASNYGKANLLKDIIEERYNKKLKTHISLNYKKGEEGDLNSGLEQIGEKYGDRIYDRIFDMFNVIEFKGKSFRK